MGLEWETALSPKKHAFKYISIATLLLTAPAQAAADVSIGNDCRPKGVIAKAQEAWNPKTFWKAQLAEINRRVEGQKTAYRLFLFERQRGIIEGRMDAQEARILGVPQVQDPALDRQMAEIDRDIWKMEKQWLDETIEWGKRCEAYANAQIASQ